MNETQALTIIYENLLGVDSIPVLLRNKQGLDRERFDATIEALEFLVEFYRGKDLVPKRLALCMVDIYGAFDFDENFYDDEDQRNEIEDAGIQLQELANDLFSEEEEP